MPCGASSHRCAGRGAATRLVLGPLGQSVSSPRVDLGHAPHVDERLALVGQVTGDVDDVGEGVVVGLAAEVVAIPEAVRIGVVEARSVRRRLRIGCGFLVLRLIGSPRAWRSGAGASVPLRTVSTPPQLRVNGTISAKHRRRPPGGPGTSSGRRPGAAGAPARDHRSDRGSGAPGGPCRARWRSARA